MSKITLFSLVIILAIATTTGFIISRVSPPVKVNIHAKDLPEWGLIIVKPTDNDFEVLAAPFLQDIPKEDVEAIKPLTIIIKNNGDRTAVAHTIIWECTDANGGKKTYRKSYANSEFFTEGEEYLRILAGTNMDETIAPKGIRLLSLNHIKRDGPSGGGGGSHQNQDEAQPGQDSLKNVDAEGVQESSSQLIKRYTDITVSIDGVFFDDGSFIGPDTFGFFDHMKAQIDAKRDLLNIIADSAEQKKSEAEIFKALQDRADMEVLKPTDKASLTDYYNFFSKFFAAQILQQRRVFGPDRVIDIALRSRARPRPNLNKLGDTAS